MRAFYDLLSSMRSRRQYDYYFFAFDSKSTYRKTVYNDYKANRPSSSIANMSILSHHILLLCNAMGFCSVRLKGWEADDIITYIVMSNTNLSHTIWTSDKDLYQLLHQGKVNIVNRSHAIYKHNLLDYFPVSSHQVVEYLCLVGDSSDNIKGIKGVGKVRASQMLHRYNSIDNIMKNLDDLRPSIAKSLQEGQDIIDDNRRCIDLLRFYSTVQHECQIRLIAGQLSEINDDVVTKLLSLDITSLSD